MVGKEDVDGFVGLSESGGSHRDHAVVPSPCGVPFPMFFYPLEGCVHGDRAVDGRLKIEN